MRLRADLHTHTVASGHAHSTLAENIGAARAAGLELIAVTDHGPALPGMPPVEHFGELRELPMDVGGVMLLTGVEANMVPTSNGLDLPNDVLATLDVVGVGLHPVDGVDEEDREGNTALILGALANPLVDVLTHPGRSPWLIDVDRVVSAAKDAGVAVEINGLSFSAARAEKLGAEQERRFLEAAVEAGLTFTIASDAHEAETVGRFGAALRVAEELGVAEDRVVGRDAASVLAFLLARRVRPHLAAQRVSS